MSPNVNMVQFLLKKLIILNLLLSNILCKTIRILPNEEIFECPDVSPEHQFRNYVNVSSFEIIRLDDDTVQFSGYMVFLQGFVPTILGLEAKTQAFNMGVWQDTPLSFVLSNTCPRFNLPTDFWYSITKHFYSAGCPPKKGVRILRFLFFFFILINRMNFGFRQFIELISNCLR